MFIGNNTLAFDFEQDSIHLINVDHGFEYFIKLVDIILNLSIKEFSIKVISSIGSNMREIALRNEVLGVFDITIFVDVGFKGGSEYPSDKSVHG